MANATTEERRRGLGAWFSLCPLRHILLLLSGLLIGAYFLLRDNFALMTWLSNHVARPWHRLSSRACSHVPVSVAALLIAALVVFSLVYIIRFLVSVIRKGGRAARIYRFCVTAATLVCGIYALFCLLWGVYYYTSDFEEQSGIRGQPVSVEQLERVTRYFAGLVNTYGEQVHRDEQGCFDEELDAVFARSASLYDSVERLCPCLEGDDLCAKPFLFSKGMSLLNFTGFFCPFTGEANINVDAPACLIPSTIAHEIAHQRGVAAEDEANFVAVLASLTDGDPVYCYSSCLLAYIHLGNALYNEDVDAWRTIYSSLSNGARADLAANNAYWARFETPVSTVSDTVYTGFLQSYGQSLGLKSYGACIDLLVAYYDEYAQ